MEAVAAAVAVEEPEEEEEEEPVVPVVLPHRLVGKACTSRRCAHGS